MVIKMEKRNANANVNAVEIAMTMTMAKEATVACEKLNEDKEDE